MGEPGADPAAPLYPRVPRGVGVLVGMGIAVVGIVVLLVTGGADAPGETRGDLTYIAGDLEERQPERAGELVASIADITTAEVSSDGGEIVFRAQATTAIPQPLRKSALEFRWDLTGGNGSTWTVAATIDRTRQATVLSSDGFGAATVDDTFPGDVAVTRDVVEVRFDPRELPEFPSGFEWSLATALRAFRDQPDSPRVEDRFPDEGFDHFER